MKNAKLKEKFKSIVEKIKKFFKVKKNRNVAIAIAAIILIVIIVAIITDKARKNRFALNTIYNVYPEEVRELYSNIVEVSCSGDLHLNISLDTGKVELKDMDKNNLIDYMFSNLDKNNMLSNKMESNIIEKTASKLFYGDINLKELINNYNYNGYIYNVDKKTITRKEDTCKSDMNYVSDLYGYSYNANELSVDVNIGYLKDGTLYDLADTNIGAYDGDAKQLREMFKSSSFYRFNYVLDNKVYKLKSVEWNSRT